MSRYLWRIPQDWVIVHAGHMSIIRTSGMIGLLLQVLRDWGTLQTSDIVNAGYMSVIRTSGMIGLLLQVLRD
jgi:hypothetical protein